MTVRDDILDAFDRLERRHGRTTYSPAEIISEVRAVPGGDSYTESTLRTHIVSSMCTNAPANHATRYPDLERVSRGQYRRLSRECRTNT